MRIQDHISRYFPLIRYITAIILSMMAIVSGLLGWLGAMDNCTGTGTAANGFTHLCTWGYQLAGLFVVLMLGILAGLIVLFRSNLVRETIKYAALGMQGYRIKMDQVLFGCSRPFRNTNQLWSTQFARFFVPIARPIRTQQRQPLSPCADFPHFQSTFDFDAIALARFLL